MKSRDEAALLCLGVALASEVRKGLEKSLDDNQQELERLWVNLSRLHGQLKTGERQYKWLTGEFDQLSQSLIKKRDALDDEQKLRRDLVVKVDEARRAVEAQNATIRGLREELSHVQGVRDDTCT